MRKERMLLGMLLCSVLANGVLTSLYHELREEKAAIVAIRKELIESAERVGGLLARESAIESFPLITVELSEEERRTLCGQAPPQKHPEIPDRYTLGLMWNLSP